MLVESAKLQELFRENQMFDFYSSLVESFVSYLKSVEGINVSIETSSENEEACLAFSQMPLELQRAKTLNFKNYYDHCVDVISEGHSLKDKVASLQRFSFLYGLNFPSKNEIYDLLDKDVYAEVYDKKFLQIYRNPNWLETTSHGLKTIETSDWRKLFFRSDEILENQMKVVTALYNGEITQPVHKPIEVHTVKELKSRAPYCCEIESLLYSPVYDIKGEFIGGLHIMKIHNLRTLNYQICT